MWIFSCLSSVVLASFVSVLSCYFSIIYSSLWALNCVFITPIFQGARTLHICLARPVYSTSVHTLTHNLWLQGVRAPLDWFICSVPDINLHFGSHRESPAAKEKARLIWEIKKKRNSLCMCVLTLPSSMRDVLEGRAGIDCAIGPQRENHLACAASFSP